MHQRIAIAAAVAFVAGLLVGPVSGLVSGTANAQEASYAACVQVPQRPDRLADDMIVAWMNEQLAEGRTNFESVTGLSTVLCAW